MVTVNIDYQRLLSRTHTYTFLAFLLIFLFLFNLGAAIPVAPSRSSGITQDYKNSEAMVTNSTAPMLFLYIASNNMLIALGAGIGGFLPFIAIFNSGQVVQAIEVGSNSTHQVPAVALTLITIIMPHTIVEVSAYAVGATAGIWLLAAALSSVFKRIFMPNRKRYLRAEANVFPIELLFAGFLVVLAAALETILIYSESVGLALWLPLFIGIWQFRKWAKKKAKGPLPLLKEDLNSSLL